MANSKPNLKQVWPSSPFRPLFNELNRAVEDQSGFRTGDGFGVMGRSIIRTSQDWMVGYTLDGGAGAAIKSADGKKWTLGKGDALECTLEIDENDEVSIVLAKPADADEPEGAATRFTYYNPNASDITGKTLVFMNKRFGLWMPVLGGGGAIARAKCTVEIPSGSFDGPSSSGEAQIYSKDDDGNWEPSGDPVQVWCQHDMSTPVPVDGTIHIGSIQGDWYLITRDC